LPGFEEAGIDMPDPSQAQPVQKTIGGVTFEDRFAHLHEDTPEALDWQWARDTLAQRAIDASPNFVAVRDRLLELNDGGGLMTPRKRGAFWFGLMDDGADQIVRASAEPYGPGRIIVSNRMIADANGGGEVRMYRLVASPKGRYVAVAWSADGDMVGQWSVYEVATGRHLVTDTSAAMHTGSLPGWLPDESGYWLDGRTPEALHRLRFTAVAAGTAPRADVILPETLVEARHSGMTIEISPDGRRAIAVSMPHERLALAHIDLETLEATSFTPAGLEGECDGSWIDGEHFAARINVGESRGWVAAIPVSTWRDRLTWRTLVPEGEGFVSWAGVVAGRLYVGDLVDVSLRVRVFALDGSLIETLPLETPGASPSMMFDRAVRPTDAFLLSHATLKRSAVGFVHDPDTGALRQIGEGQNRLEGATVEQRFATSRDGTRVPYFLVYHQDLDRSRPQPVLAYGYGGFNSSQLPVFRPQAAPIVEAGGVFVLTCLRGGGEYGRAWHDGGRLLNKRNTFDDLQAIAEALIAEGVSSPDRMAFTGGSNGGMLAGAAIVFQPGLWRAVIPVVPVFDMMEPLRPGPAFAGLRAIFIEDYGSPEDPEAATSILDWSPYHNVRDGVAYPAIFQQFGEKDLGCMPFHGRKFTARLDEANAGDRPIQLRVWRNINHAPSDPTDHAIFTAEGLAFAMDQIGLTARGPRA
jgi:prolyl oligopeptidase